MEAVDIFSVDTQTIIERTVSVLSRGGVVIYPTETVYGIGVDATNQRAVDTVLAYKARREGKPMSIAVSDQAMASRYVKLNPTAENLYAHFLPGPLTVVSESLGTVAEGVASESGTLGLRIPDYPLIRDIISAFGKPITSTSANASYKKRPYTIDDIFSSLSDRQKGMIDLVLDAGTLPKREPSTVVDTTLHQEITLRQGDIRTGEREEFFSTSPEDTQRVGQQLVERYRHYLGYKSVIFALQGNLGAGKTEMTKGIAQSLRILDPIRSPTFTIEHEYPMQLVADSFAGHRPKKMFHIDTWRLSHSSELVDLDFYSQVQDGHFFVIEWADRILDLLDTVVDDAIVVWISLDYRENPDERIIRVSHGIPSQTDHVAHV